MGLEDSSTVDAVGVERESGAFVLTLLDSWTWDEPEHHLMALQAKLEAYLDFIESGEIYSACPDAREKEIVIDVISRVSLPAEGTELLERLVTVAGEMGVRVRTKQVPG
jgi:hypothetical protein